MWKLNKITKIGIYVDHKWLVCQSGDLKLFVHFTNVRIVSIYIEYILTIISRILHTESFL